jgi:hypothetical protein
MYFIRLRRNTLQIVGVKRKSRPSGLREASLQNTFMVSRAAGVSVNYV